jgi:cation diffusion facilitator CzcD-associated flavoprotein CzcO
MHYTHEDPHVIDVVVIGGGQAGLAAGYYLRRTNLSWVMLDAEAEPGGAWLHGWASLRLFSPAAYSSLPGWLMPGAGADDASPTPSRNDVIRYFSMYEERYALAVQRPVWVQQVERDGEHLVVVTNRSSYRARAVISATGTWRAPYVPTYPGQDTFEGVQIHSAAYRAAEPFAGQRVVVVGGGNSAAHILAEVSEVADTIWVTPDPPTFLPDEVDGRVLFERATARFTAQQRGESYHEPAGGLGSIVVVPSVKDARARGVLQAVRPFTRLTAHGLVWPNGSETAADTIIWCTGFRAALDHLALLGVLNEHGYVTT